MRDRLHLFPTFGDLVWVWAAVAIVAVQALSSTVLLYARTGAWLEQPYDWYSLRTTGERRFAKTTPLPSQILSTCRYRNASAALEEMLTVEDVVEEHTSQQRESKVGATRTIVYVVPYGTDGVIELSAKHVEPVRDRNASSSLRVLSGSARDRTVDYERAAPVDELTLFPTLWHSILGPHFSDQVEAPSAWSRIVEPLGLEYRIVRSQRELSALPSSSNVFAVVQWMPNILRLLESGELPADARVGYLALSREDCSNANVRQYIDAKQLKFGLLPYGDCSLVDGERFAVVPLGPSFEHGFPTNSHKTPIPPIDKRKFLLSLMVSWTVEKPTRIQAMMAALRACDEGHACIVEHSALAFKALQKVDELMGLNLRWFLSSAPNTYVENLKQSVFTLCPHGKNPEQYRIWEALAAGSIPVVEEFPRQSLPGTFYHPSYPTSWKCVPEDIHGVLKRLKAPVLFVRDWRRDLPRIVDKYVNNEDGPKRLLELQRRARQWYADLGQHLQADMLRKSLHHFAASP
ncbi:hypothetical protein PybrP1_009788 [[Pythium] brassicae (nom. inval.)]|nr:hypothetical protein PybrP1_009788 [[Pythium] brassicae (nom. inval.)]